MKSYAFRLKITLIISSILTALILGFLVVIFVFSNYKNDYINNINKTVTNNSNMFIRTLDTISYSLSSVAKKESIISYTENTLIDKNLNLSLISIINQYPTTSNITIYSTKHNNNYTVPAGTGFYNYPQISSFSKNNSFNDFFEDTSKSTFLSVRKDNVPSLYDWSNYDNNFGILSLIQKIYADNIVVGYLFLDFKPSVIERYSFNYRVYPENTQVITLLSDENDSFLLTNTLRDGTINVNKDNYNITGDEMIIHKSISNYGIVSIINLSYLSTVLMQTIIITIVSALALCTITSIVTNIFINNTKKQLYLLIKRMSLESLLII